jgi:Na+/H+-dicarboxylate symporter
MKLWIRLILATAAGILLGMLLPLSGGDTESVFLAISSLVINLGRYIVFPLVFFSASIAVYELWIDRKLLPLAGFILLGLILTTLFTVGLASVLFLIIQPERIPIIIKEGDVLGLPNMLELIRNVIPQNLFLSFVNDGNFLLPVFFFAVVIGLVFHYHKAHAEPSLDFFDSMSRVLFRVNHYVVEIMMLGFALLAGYRTLQIRGFGDIELFFQLFMLLILLLGLVAFGLYPLIFFIVTRLRKKTGNPYQWLAAVIIPALAGLLAGDNYFTYGFLVRTGKEEQLLPRRGGSTIFPLSIMFAKAGTAAVIAVSFMLILRSYSSLEITTTQFFWVIGASMLVSLLLSGVPGMGVVIGLAVVSSWYGQGLEEGYLILLPAAPFLIAFGVLIDTLTAGLLGSLAARTQGLEFKNS